MIGTIIIGLVILALLWDYLFKKHRKDVLIKSKIPGRKALPLVGSALQFRGLNAENMIDFMRATVKERGKIFHSWILHQLTIFSADPKDLEVLLSSQVHITKNNVYDMLSLWLGDGLLMSTGKKWHKRRKIITPTFHFKILEQFVEIMDQQSTIMVQKLEATADGTTVVDMFPIVCLSALDIIAETSMGVKVNAQMNPQFSYVKAVQRVTEKIAERLRRPTWRFDWLFRVTAPEDFNSMMENIEVMKKFTEDVIQKRRAALEQTLREKPNPIDKEEEDGIGSKKRMALLDVLLQSTVDNKPLSNEDIREEVETFMFEGHDTTTSGVSFALFLISRHKEVQDKLFQEIREVVGDDKLRPISHRELHDMKYMECVLKESMRLYPPVPIIGRFFAEDVEINNKIIPGNTHFNMPLFIVFRDPDYFKDPNEFNPDRFSIENNEEISPFAFVPFSAGPRNCIGQKYAMLEMKSVISKVLRYYELLPLGPDVIPSLSLIMRSKNGINMGLKHRVYT